VFADACCTPRERRKTFEKFCEKPLEEQPPIILKRKEKVYFFSGLFL
jgi:hypothetical protein